jgi:3-phosphoshikimate 1-carboxyvinyltransferase
MRLLAGFLAGQRFDTTLDGSEQLRRRPMGRVTGPLREMGAAIDDTNGLPPIRIGAALHPLRGIEYDMPIASAQVKGALLLAGLYADGPVTIQEPAPTRDHTERMLRAAGVAVSTEAGDDGYSSITLLPPDRPLRPLDMLVPADFSSAAYFVVAAAISPNSRLRLAEVGLNRTRIGLLDALRRMGAHVADDDVHDQGGEPMGHIEVGFSELHGIEVGGELIARMIDEFPVFAVAATQATGTTVVRDAAELRVKESNRLEGMVNELRKLGAQIEPTADGFIIDGPTRLRGTVVDGLGDHRVAMALAVAALVSDGETIIRGAECVSKTYPRFFHDLNSLCRVPGWESGVG